MRTFFIIFGFVVVTGVAIFGFRGTITTRPPIEVFPDMDRQPRYQAQGESEFFADGRADRLPVAGTVGRGHLPPEGYDDRGQISDGEYLDGFPQTVTLSMLERGQERYEIYCSACHGSVGDGQGITTNYGMVGVPSFHTERLRNQPNGEVYDVIRNGRGLMGPYGGVTTAEDRWNIIAYLRALQRANMGTIDDVPAEERSELGL